MWLNPLTVEKREIWFWEENLLVLSFDPLANNSSYMFWLKYCDVPNTILVMELGSLLDVPQSMQSYLLTST